MIHRCYEFFHGVTQRTLRSSHEKPAPHWQGWSAFINLGQNHPQKSHQKSKHSVSIQQNNSAKQFQDQQNIQSFNGQLPFAPRIAAAQCSLGARRFWKRQVKVGETDGVWSKHDMKNPAKHGDAKPYDLVNWQTDLLKWVKLPTCRYIALKEHTQRNDWIERHRTHHSDAESPRPKKTWALVDYTLDVAI